MRLSRRVSLAGTQLDSLDERIIISGFEEEAADMNRGNIPLYREPGIGSWQTYEQLTSKRVTVKFVLRIDKRSYAARAEVLEKVTAWAMTEGWLKSSTRPDRRIYVRCTQLPKLTDPRNWTGEYSMTFTAFERPFWQNDTAVSAKSSSASSGSVTLQLDGNLKSVVSITLENRSGALVNTVTLSAGGNKMSFASLGLAAGESLVIDYTVRQVQRIRILQANGQYRSVMDKRTGADDLVVSPGSVAVSFTAQRACRMTASATGRYA